MVFWSIFGNLDWSFWAEFELNSSGRLGAWSFIFIFPKNTKKLLYWNCKRLLCFFPFPEIISGKGKVQWIPQIRHIYFTTKFETYTTCYVTSFIFRIFFSIFSSRRNVWSLKVRNFIISGHLRGRYCKLSSLITFLNYSVIYCI